MSDPLKDLTLAQTLLLDLFRRHWNDEDEYTYDRVGDALDLIGRVIRHLEWKARQDLPPMQTAEEVSEMLSSGVRLSGQKESKTHDSR